MPDNPSLVCEVCGARVATLRRGRCWICYVRWAETRPVGAGAVCLICGDRRRGNLRLVEFQGTWIVMCHNCGTRATRLSPMPASLETVRHLLRRDRRFADRREGKPDRRIFQRERRVGERRLPADATPGDWLDAADLIIEIIELNEGDEPAEATRIVQQPQPDPSSEGPVLDG